MVHFDTKHYTIWVDRMNDGSIRYASWKRGAPASEQPDLVLLNGSYDKTKGICTFRNDIYTYRVFFGKNIVKVEVLKNGRLILEEKK